MIDPVGKDGGAWNGAWHISGKPRQMAHLIFWQLPQSFSKAEFEFEITRFYNAHSSCNIVKSSLQANIS
jgi:hypothetical protein